MEISRYYFTKVAIIICLLSISRIASATINQIIKVHIKPSPIYTRVIIESNRTINYRQFIPKKSAEHIVIDIKNINLNSVIRKTNTKVHDNPHIKSFCIDRFNQKTVRLILGLKKNTKLHSFTLSPSTDFKHRLIINLCLSKMENVRDLTFTLINNRNKKHQKHLVLPIRNSNVIHSNKNNNKHNQYNRPIIIMLDPGHGGEDSGAIGKYHTLEKDVVLQIARRLKSLIENEENMRVYMERNEDIFIPLKVRVIKARQQCADLFISIHADAFSSRQSSGSSVFALSDKGATSTEDKYFSDIRNTSNLISGIRKSGDYYLDHTMFEMAQSLTIKDSLRFAKIVLNNLGKINKLHKGFVDQAGFEVLKAPDIPSILVETAFISNVEEEHKLKTAKFQQRIAESILAGIKAYISNSKI